MTEIKNKVSNSALISLDLQEFLPNVVWKGIDIAHFLEDGFILREKPFRIALNDFDFSLFKNTYVYIFCSTKAIFPDWVYLLISQKVSAYSKNIFIGEKDTAESQLLEKILFTFDYSVYTNKSLIIKGCNSKSIKAQNLNQFYLGCLPYAKSIMFGEACSAVPLYKKPK